jgi:flagellar L-ring protein FlgH
MTTPYKYISSSLAALGIAALAAAPLEASPVDGSLWLGCGGSERSMFADKVATRIGDIITIEVSESSSLASKVKMSTSKESTVKNDFTKLLFTDVLRSHGDAPSTDLTTANNTHAGSGTLDNSHTITAEISVQVIDVLPNGNLVLEGTRVITYAGETYYMLTQGVCRPDDVTIANTIKSGQIADARIEVVAEGSLNEAEREGWGEKLANKISP